MSLFLADLVLVLHFAIALFITGSLPLIWLGAAAGWRWVRHFGLRALHLFAILFVSAEALAGLWCPLTLLEDALRGSTAERSFISRWVHALLFHDLPPWMFTAAYLVFAVLVALTWWRVPPRRKGLTTGE